VSRSEGSQGHRRQTAWHFLADASANLATSLDYRNTPLQTVSVCKLPLGSTIAAWCVNARTMARRLRTPSPTSIPAHERVISWPGARCGIYRYLSGAVPLALAIRHRFRLIVPRHSADDCARASHGAMMASTRRSIGRTPLNQPDDGSTRSPLARALFGRALTFATSRPGLKFTRMMVRSRRIFGGAGLGRFRIDNARLTATIMDGRGRLAPSAWSSPMRSFRGQRPNRGHRGSRIESGRLTYLKTRRRSSAGVLLPFQVVGK